MNADERGWAGAELAIPPELREELEAWQRLGAEAVENVAPLAHESW
jgi:hypothetical protein